MKHVLLLFFQNINRFLKQPLARIPMELSLYFKIILNNITYKIYVVFILYELWENILTPKLNYEV
ncbi:MAG: hypothetical protein A2068_03260 [Ignavibacteria bacterium GWB2_35_6b]|nr:MAG: hypothetical protein A2068_03260 [Ignavibacteria bacterium GWB2_35_6b]